MSIFNLPDLGEGLPDAEIHEWFVKEGDVVKADQPLVSMETAKAVVDVPAPQDGIISKLYGKTGDVIKTGQPLVGFEADKTTTQDKGTVVGNLEESTDIIEDNYIIGASHTTRIKTTPAVRMMARKLGVDLSKVVASGEHGMITKSDVEKIAQESHHLEEGYESLKGVRRAMLHSMVQSHQQVVPVSIYDEADINAWGEQTDITVRLIKAIVYACAKEPALNAWFDSLHSARKCFDKVNLGLAMDNEEGLFVPTLPDAASHSDNQLREFIDGFKTSVSNRTISPELLKGATITLSNFGKFSGRFASPIIVPPTVAILAVGKLYEGAVVHNGKLEPHRLLPLSLSFDHRAVTGGEATRFLGAVIDSLASV
jgi:2-oxoisovalerate dehydrogenase E2 component (dihydrolipoyl transacylase)